MRRGPVRPRDTDGGHTGHTAHAGSSLPVPGTGVERPLFPKADIRRRLGKRLGLAKPRHHLDDASRSGHPAKARATHHNEQTKGEPRVSSQKRTMLPSCRNDPTILRSDTSTQYAELQMRTEPYSRTALPRCSVSQLTRHLLASGHTRMYPGTAAYLYSVQFEILTPNRRFGDVSNGSKRRRFPCCRQTSVVRAKSRNSPELPKAASLLV